MNHFKSHVVCTLKLFFYVQLTHILVQYMLNFETSLCCTCLINVDSLILLEYISENVKIICN